MGKKKSISIFMGISRSSIHKRLTTGGRRRHWRKSRKYELGRPAANTKLGNKPKIILKRVRGGNFKFKGLILDHGNMSWGSEAISCKTRILNVVSNKSKNNELVRTKTLVKGAIIQVDANPFKKWYVNYYGVDPSDLDAKKVKKRSNHIISKFNLGNKQPKLSDKLKSLFKEGKLIACISSRPGQCGRADGYILEGNELNRCLKTIPKKEGKQVTKKAFNN